MDIEAIRIREGGYLIRTVTVMVTDVDNPIRVSWRDKCAPQGMQYVYIAAGKSLVAMYGFELVLVSTFSN